MKFLQSQNVKRNHMKKINTTQPKQEIQINEEPLPPVTHLKVNPATELNPARELNTTTELNPAEI
jgi:hypothetical protein